MITPDRILIGGVGAGVLLGNLAGRSLKWLWRRINQTSPMDASPEWRGPWPPLPEKPPGDATARRRTKEILV